LTATDADAPAAPGPELTAPDDMTDTALEARLLAAAGTKQAIAVKPSLTGPSTITTSSAST